MISALVRALAAPAHPPLRRIVATSLVFAVASFAGLWAAVAWLLHEQLRFAWPPLEWLVELLGAGAVLGLCWLLFPAVATLFMGLFLDRVAAAVEALDYPGRGPARRQPVHEI